jgi:PAS domain S-box-containing protein/diguanylate cyclase (GGDEF)-like protein
MIFIIRIEDGYIEYANRHSINSIGYTVAQMNEVGMERFRHPLKEDEDFRQHLQELKEKGRLTDYAVVIRKDGTEFPVEVNVRSVRYHGIDYNIAIARDITERFESEAKLIAMNEQLEKMVQERTRQLQHHIARLESYKNAMDANSIVSISDVTGKIIYVNENFCQVSGYSADEVMGKQHNILRHPDTPDTLFKEMWNTIRAKKIWKGVLKNRKKNGDYYSIDSAILPILDDQGEIVEYIAIRHEITQLMEQKEKLHRQAYMDEMSGFGSRLRLIEDAREIPSPLLSYIDIDQFNNINDFYGLAFGDRVLQEFAKRLQSEFGTGISYYRLHGDHFAILTEESRLDVCADRLQAFIERFNRQNFLFEGKELTLRITASISTEKGDKLLPTCDLAKRYAKKHQKTFVVYMPEMGLEEEVRANMDCAVRVQHALNEERIVVYCQAIASAESLEVTKYECLMRMIAQDGTVTTPFHFLEAAKHSKQYGELSKRMITKVFELLEHHRDKSFSINITIDDILNKEIVALIMDKLSAKRSFMPVIFELVESEGIENFKEVTDFIRQIKSFGSLLAIDDFGTGYSNFEYLLKLDADIIKIDGSLIRNIANDPTLEAIVGLITNFAKQQNIQTVAEFVASEKILEKVRGAGIDFVQGYYIGRPEPLF